MLGFAESRIQGSGGASSLFQIKTTKQTNFTITIACSTYNRVVIYWGDGTSTAVSGGTAITKSWAASGEQTVTITGELDKITYLTCSNQQVTEATLSSALVNIAGFVFTDNLNLTELIIPEECTKIISLYLAGTGLYEIVLPPTVIALSAFRAFSCPNLTKIDARCITSCTYEFMAYSCPNLTEIDARNATGNVPFFNVYNNPLLSSVKIAFTSSTGEFFIHTCPSLTEIDLSTCTGSFVFVYTYNSGFASLTIPFTNCHTFNSSFCPNLESIDCPNLASCSNSITVNGCPNLTSFNISNLAGTIKIIDANNTAIFSFATKLTTISSILRIYNCPNLTTIDVSTLTTVNALYCRQNPALNPPSIAHFTSVFSIDFASCGLSQAEVDAVLADCIIISNTDTSCDLKLNNTTGSPNAAPSAAGLANKATLISRGWSVTTA